MTTVILLAEFNPIKPDPGLILWTSVVFLVVYYLLSRFAFRPIQEALKKRERDIQHSLDEAKRAREDMAKLKAGNEELLKQAQEERSKILREAKEAKEMIITEAREKAKEEARTIVANAKQDIENMRQETIIDMKNQLGTIAIDIARTVLRDELKDKQTQERYVNQMIDEIKLN